MKTEMEGLDLFLWRRERRIKQYDLAALLGKSRATLTNWERGHVRIPPWVPLKLAELAFTLAPKPTAAPPERVTSVSAKLRPDLKLYFTSHGYDAQDSEHPDVLLLASPRGPGEPAQPWSVLESPEYLEALERRRADPAPYRAQKGR